MDLTTPSVPKDNGRRKEKTMAMKARYTVVNGEVIAQQRSGARHLYTPNPLGSTVALISSSQTKTDTWSYWPYGEVKTRTGTTPTPFQFVGTLGYYRDSESRAYVRARYLDKLKARWLTENPIGFQGMDWNLFRYATDNPISAFDRTGLSYCGNGGQTAPRDCEKEHEDCLDRNTAQFVIATALCSSALIAGGLKCKNLVVPKLIAICMAPYLIIFGACMLAAWKLRRDADAMCNKQLEDCLRRRGKS
jgi:RHS repeat-associated protein